MERLGLGALDLLARFGGGIASRCSIAFKVRGYAALEDGAAALKFPSGRWRKYGLIDELKALP